MASLWAVLDAVYPRAELAKAGGADSRDAPPIDTVGLQKALGEVNRNNRAWFGLAAGIGVLLFLVIVSSPFWAGAAEAAGLVTAVAGVPAMVLVRWLKSLW